jgi:hypothetical protein
METLELIGKGLVLSAPTRISKETKCKAIIKRDEPMRLIIEGDEKDLCEALELIAKEDLFAEVNDVTCSDGADFMFSEKRIKRILREAKRERFTEMLAIEFEAVGIPSCPINSYGYLPFPFNTPKTLEKDQERDVKQIAMCVQHQTLAMASCRGCYVASMQRAMAERKKEPDGD